MELLIVMGVLAVLIGSLITILDPVTQLKRGRDGTRKSDLSQIQSALELFRADHGCYPHGTCLALAAFPSCGNNFSAGGVTYMSRIPCDPINAGQHKYTYDSTGTTYNIYSCLENINDLLKDNPNNPIYCNGTTNWSYTVRNP
ncbi:MAG: hypothetical protein A2687_02225 [Candidatus Levybacteria bacterium RIFCSPHIGHO2_01_FULL_38_26]|nr:MAG: hypothetical protein A2687_02225 [Candidatus Levybacteria bacterium RIFCSPHIGHO2_01_FULL_38_26]